MNQQLDLVLSRLEPFRLRESGTDRWRARCPAHGGENATTLSVRLGENDAVLLHCHAGCDVEQVAHALGIELVDLFPAREASAKGNQRPWLPADVFDAVRQEIGVAAVIAMDMLQHKTISNADWERLAQASRTLDDIARTAYGRR